MATAGRWLKESVLLRKFATVQGFVQRSSGVKLVGLEGHIKIWLTDAGFVRQSGQVSSMTLPMRSW